MGERAKGNEVVGLIVLLWLVLWCVALIAALLGIWTGDGRWGQTAVVALCAGAAAFFVALLAS